VLLCRFSLRTTGVVERFKPLVIGVGGGASRGGVLSLSVLLACKYEAKQMSV